MFIADFHIHSKYSRATSGECVPEMLEMWAQRKGLGLIGTGDFTHAVWRDELKGKLVQSEEGLYALKDEFRKEDNVAGSDIKPRFIVSGEISSIYKKNGKVRKVHNLILLPSLEDAEAVSHRLEALGGNLHSDGRPILGLDSRDLLEITLEACPKAIFIPAHIWTPHFSLFGAYSGFDDIQECFGDLTGNIHALETGLSSDPPMNWRLSALDKYTLVSNSDAHSPANLAREANLFETDFSYPSISRALENHSSKEFIGTIEFFPEEGKYHYDGHRNCKVCLKPSDTREAGGVCPVCGGKITVGVLHRVEVLADRQEGFVPPDAKHFESLVPLHEVIAASIGLTTASVKVKEKYNDLIRDLGSELFILREAELNDIELKAGALVAEGIRRLRSKKVEVNPGYDGEYGKIKILDKNEIGQISGQLGLLGDKEGKALKTKKKPEPKYLLRDAPAKPELSLFDISLTEKTKETVPVTPKEALDGLNPEQRKAVTAVDPVIAVIAGPGTGKTRTLVSRIIYLIEKCGVSPAQITAVTFTNRAANEMRTRLIKHFGNSRIIKELTIGTFHSICLKFLSEQNQESAITVIDEQDALSIVEEVLKRYQLKGSPREALKYISLKKSGVQVSEEKTKIPPEVLHLYSAQLHRYGVLDYDDILLNTLKLLWERRNSGQDNKVLLNSFSHLLVDEFQDINATQYHLIQEWGQCSAGIFVIGDPDQAIYGFRGSDARCFNRLAEDFSNLRQIRLTQNYRSTPEIIRCAQAIILNPDSGGQAGSLESRRESGPWVQLLEANDEFSEALFVTKEIDRMVGGIDMLDAHQSPLKNGKTPVSGQSRSFSDIAVLYRTNRQARILEECFRKEGIPYIVVGRDEFLSDPDVRKTVAFFRFILNPADLVSLRFCLKAWDVCQTDSLQKVLESYSTSEKSVTSLLDILPGQISPSGDQPAKFLELLKKYEPLVRQEKPPKLIESWANDNGLKDIPGMEMLLNMAVLYEDISSLLQNLLLGRESDVVRSGRRSYSPDAVFLMTLHGAKGLEFPIVFLCGLKEGVIPLHNHDGDCHIDEERRLLYVGMTRAQDELMLLAPGIKSPFLSGLPKDSMTLRNTFTPSKASKSKQLNLFDL